MKLQFLSDQALLENTLILVQREKEILSEVLAHLQEVQRRRLFSEGGNSSLFQYCVKQLGYSEDQAYRRINALKLIREIPEVQNQIARGELTLSNLSVAQSLFKMDGNVNKKDVLNALKHKSKRESEKVIREFSPKAPEFRKEVLLSLSRAQEEKWNAVKAKLAHCNLRDEEILERLCDFFLEPKYGPKSKSKSVSELSLGVERKISQRSVHSQSKTPREPAPSKSSASPPNRRIPAGIRREVFRRDQNCCTQCGSLYALQVDYKLSLAVGGTHELKNLRLLCRNCNQRAAIRLLGHARMGRFLG